MLHNIVLFEVAFLRKSLASKTTCKWFDAFMHSYVIEEIPSLDELFVSPGVPAEVGNSVSALRRVPVLDLLVSEWLQKLFVDLFLCDVGVGLSGD